MSALGAAALALLAATPVRMSYARADDAAACIAEDELRAAVVRRLGWVPFDDAAADALQVSVARKGSGFVARLVRTRGERELYTPRADCADLGEALAFAISVAIDPASMFAPPPDAGAPPPPAEVAVDAGLPEQPPDAGVTVPVPEPPVGVPLEAGVALGAAVGLAPVASMTVRAELRWRWRLFSLGLHLRADLFGRLEILGGAVSATGLQLGVVPCFHFSALAACAVVSGGLLISSASGLPDAATGLTPVFLVGARLSYSLVFGRWQPFVWAEGGAAVARTSVFVGDTAAWTSPPAWGGGGLGFFFAPP